MKVWRVKQKLRKQWRGPSVLILLGMVMFGYIGVFSGLNQHDDLVNSDRQSAKSFEIDTRSHHRKLLASNDTTQSSAIEPTTAAVRKSEYPNDIFTEEELKDGAVVLYVIGMVYMFVALALVCDEFFVPSLEVIIDVLGISEDVAGATFMAAGGSAPQLFTSIIAVFVAYSDVGIGTIVGSAVFNILFVIGMCAIFSKGILLLTWWPLFRDVTFYSISLVALILCFRDNEIYWYEALILLLCYALYVIFMKFNHHVEMFVKTKILKSNSVQTVRSTDNLITTIKTNDKNKRTTSLPTLRSGSSKFRQGMLQLMIHTIDPLGDAKVQDKAVKLHAIASLNVIVTQENGASDKENGQKNGNVPAISNGTVLTPENERNLSQQTNVSTVGSIYDYNNEGSPNGVSPPQNNTTTEVGTDESSSHSGDTRSQTENQPPPPPPKAPEAATYVDGNKAEDQKLEDSSSMDQLEEDENEPIDLSWPDTCRKRVTYILVAPIIFPLWLTLADVKKPSARKFFPWTFIGSIIWIGGFSYLMNWWAAVTGATAGIPDAIMGLTFLAAGTSIPDLITSVIVAKKGFGDMAVSSSVGSNIFDVTVGLPFPWLLFGLIYSQPYEVISKGMFCSIILLFIMLLLIIIMIAAFKWKMTKAMGATMFGLYAVFLILAVLLELDIMPCFA